MKKTGWVSSLLTTLVMAGSLGASASAFDSGDKAVGPHNHLIFASEFVKARAPSEITRLIIAGEINFQKVSLAGANLNTMKFLGADMRGADLRGAKLAWADLTGVDLAGANLSGAQLYHANFTQATLTNADLQGSKTHGTNFSGANLEGAQVDKENIRVATINSATKLPSDPEAGS